MKIWIIVGDSDHDVLLQSGDIIAHPDIPINKVNLTYDFKFERDKLNGFIICSWNAELLSCVSYCFAGERVVVWREVDANVASTYNFMALRKVPMNQFHSEALPLP